MRSLSNKQGSFYITLLAGNRNQLLIIREAIKMMEYGSFSQLPPDFSDDLATSRNAAPNSSFGREERLELNERKNGY